MGSDPARICIASRICVFPDQFGPMIDVYRATGDCQF